MPASARAAVFFGPGKPFEIREVPIPEVEPEGVLIRVSGGYSCGVPAELSDEAVAPVNCALSQVLYGLRVAGLRFGDRVVIQGAGGLGIQAAAVAKDMGAATVIVIDQIPGRLALARAFGADHTINLKEVAERKDRVALVRTWTGGAGADIACDFVGFPQVIPE